MSNAKKVSIAVVAALICFALGIWWGWYTPIGGDHSMLWTFCKIYAGFVVGVLIVIITLMRVATYGAAD